MLTKNERAKERLYTIVLPPLLAALCFILIYGTKILNPFYDDWLLSGGDLSQHYIGWEGYRNSCWTFPIGLSDRLTYPTSISVIFTDSIPLPAVFFKLLSPILPGTFQYWGLWGLAGFMLTALVSTQLLKKYSPSPVLTITASLFFVLSPTIMQRLYGHESLGAGQWLVLASIIPLAYHGEKYKILKKATLFWGLLSFLCVGTHIYFAVTCFFSLIAFCLYDLIETKKPWTSLAAGLSYCLTAILTTWILGGLKGGIRGKGAGEVGEFSANLNCLLNPLEYSRILPALPIHGNGQYEGFAYIGLGIIIILAILAVLLKKNIKALPHVNRNKAIALAAAAVMSFLFALSPLVTLGNKLLFTLPLPRMAQKLLVTFRSTGRMVWLCFYIIYFASISLFIKSRLKLPVKITVISLCLLLHIIEFSPLISARHGRYTATQEYTNPLEQSQELASVLDEKKFSHICIASPLEGEELYGIAQFAMKNKMTVNRFWTVHQIGREEEEEILRQNLSSPQEGSIFLFKKEDESICRKYKLTQLEINGQYILGVPK